MAIAITLRGFDDLGRSTPIFLSMVYFSTDFIRLAKK